MNFNLSEKEWNDGEEGCHNMFYEEDVKEFIRRERLLLSMYKNGTLTWEEFLKRRVELAGDKLL